MAHVDEPVAFRGEAAHVAEQHLHLVRQQRGGGFVEDDHLGIGGDGLGDRDHRDFIGAQRGNERGRIDIFQADAFEQLGGSASDCRPVDEHTQAARQGFAQQQVLLHGQRRHEIAVLMHHRDAGGLRFVRIVEAHRLAADLDLATVGRIDPGDDLDEGGLAGAVLAQQGVDLAAMQIEAHGIERPLPREILGDVAHRQQGNARTGVAGGCIAWHGERHDYELKDGGGRDEDRRDRQPLTSR